MQSHHAPWSERPAERNMRACLQFSMFSLTYFRFLALRAYVLLVMVYVTIVMVLVMLVNSNGDDGFDDVVSETLKG